MVTNTNRRPTGLRKPASLLVILPVILALGSCQFLGMDMFPATLSREDAVLDLDAKMADIGVTGEYEIRRMQFATSPTTGKRYIFVVTESIGQGPRLLILDGEDLSVVSTTNYSTIVNALGIDDQGLLCSSINTVDIQRYNLETGIVTTPVTGMTLPIPTDALLGSDTSTSFFVWFNSVGFGLQHDTFESGGPIAFTSWDFQLAATFIPNLRLVSLYYEGTNIRMLFSGSYGGPSYIVTYPGTVALTSTSNPIMEDPNTNVTSIPSGDDQSGWLTRNGAIILTHDNQTRLVRYESDSGKELDSFSLSDTEDTRFTFSPDGKQWLMYDGKHGKLHLLRTWW